MENIECEACGEKIALPGVTDEVVYTEWGVYHKACHDDFLAGE